jgi:hypothetical protein
MNKNKKAVNQLIAKIEEGKGEEIPEIKDNDVNEFLMYYEKLLEKKAKVNVDKLRSKYIDQIEK